VVTSPAHATRHEPPLFGEGGSLRHVLLVGGDEQEWAAMTPERWEHRAAELGAYCAGLGVAWLTILIYGGEADAGRDGHSRRYDAGGCTVTVDGFGNGHRRFAEAMWRIAPDADINEKNVAAALYAPAEDEPDLVVVLGPSTQLPPSLVWELAYAELVFLPIAWADMSAAHLAGAVDAFALRRRRFGGLDPD
jgi:hypothetical protein